MVKRDPREDLRCKSRRRWLVIVVVLLFSVLAVRLFFLQQIKYKYYSDYAKNNQLQPVPIMAPRGWIRDRNGVGLADNVPRYDVVFPWKDEKRARRILKNLCAFLELDSSAVFARFDVWKKRNAGMPFPVVPDADKIIVSIVRENCDLFPTLRVETNAKRRYRYGSTGAHILGYVGEVSDEFLSRQVNPGAYEPGDMTGKAGIELVCESHLRGRDGRRIVAVNASGTVLGEFPEYMEPPVAGEDLYLTIDIRLQQHLERLLSERGSGAAVVMDVNDGSLLAAVSLPQFDPNRFAEGIKQEEWQRHVMAESKPLFNRFLQASYPPGSTLKIVSAYTVLLNDIAPSDEELTYCTGVHRFGNRNFHCWKAAGHGWMNLHRGIVESCDSYFFKLGQKTDVDQLASGAREFGLGEKTGIDLPNEVQGLVPDRAFYNRRYGRGQWTQGVMLNNIIGQGEFLASVLQMCRVAAAVANGGYLVTPHLIKEIPGRPKESHPRKKVRQLNGPILRVLRRAMVAVVEDADGTAHASRLKDVATAGKTGTSQNPHGEDHAWFISYAPADIPEIAVAVVAENAGHGASVAAPIVRQLYLEYFRLKSLDAVVSHAHPEAGFLKQEGGQ